MLVLSRKEGEEIIIAGNIKVTVTKVAGGRVSIGIEAPRDVKIVRGELNTQDHKGKVEASAEERKLSLSDFVQMHKMVG